METSNPTNYDNLPINAGFVIELFTPDGHVLGKWTKKGQSLDIAREYARTLAYKHDASRVEIFYNGIMMIRENYLY